MIIRTITCHHVYNHGAYLQAYALAKYLHSSGHDATIIDYRPIYKDWSPFAIQKRFGSTILNLLYTIAKFPSALMMYVRYRSFDKFFKSYMPVSAPIYRTLGELQSNPPKADVYIAGSDQIWNTFFTQGSDEAYYLGFGTARKISYAASFATDRLRQGSENKIKSFLANFQAISVREQSAIPILHSLGYNGTQVVDPAFLLSADDWNKLAEPTYKKQSYVLVYDFYHSIDIEKAAKRIAQNQNLKIFSIGPYRLPYVDKNFTNASPRTFLRLVRDAEYVISNSFHGSVFSIIYRKEFFVADRCDGLNRRMSDLLEHYNLSHRHINVDTTDEQLFQHIDWNMVLPILNSDIIQSKLFLQENINCLSHVDCC